MISVVSPRRKHLVQTSLSTQETCRYENIIGSYLKMYAVIFVHSIFVCKLIHVNLKPSKFSSITFMHIWVPHS